MLRLGNIGELKVYKYTDLPQSMQHPNKGKHRSFIWATQVYNLNISFWDVDIKMINQVDHFGQCHL